MGSGHPNLENSAGESPPIFHRKTKHIFKKLDLSHTFFQQIAGLPCHFPTPSSKTIGVETPSMRGEAFLLKKMMRIED